MKWYGHIDLQQTSRIKNVPDPQDDRDAISKYHINHLNYSIIGEWNFENGTLILPTAGTDPTGSATQGQTYWNTTDDLLYIWDGSNWKTVGGSLDDAYNIGNTITVDDGPVKLDSTSSNYSPLELTNRTNAPSSGLQAGQVAVVNNELYIYDGSRSKWLSPSKLIGFGSNGKIDGQYLEGPGTSSGRHRGWMMAKKGTIISVAAHARAGNLSKTLVLKINGSNAKVFSLVSGSYISNNDNIDFNQGDLLQIYVRAAGNAAKDVTVSLEVAWRL